MRFCRKSLALVETLLRLSDSGHYQTVSELFKIPIQNCPDMLVLALLQITVNRNQFALQYTLKETRYVPTWIEMSKFIKYDRVFCAIEDDIFQAVKSPRIISVVHFSPPGTHWNRSWSPPWCPSSWGTTLTRQWCYTMPGIVKVTPAPSGPSSCIPWQSGTCEANSMIKFGYQEYWMLLRT